MAKIHPLIAFRANRQISRSQLAATLGVSEVTVWRWESRRRVPRGAELQRLCEFSGIPAGELIGLADAHEAAE